MKKNFYIFLFIGLTIFLGMSIIENSTAQRLTDFYYGEALPSLKDNEIEKYVDAKLFTLEADRYLKDPLFNFNYNNDGAKFDFNIYHYQVKNNDKYISVMTFELFNMENIGNNIEIRIKGPSSDLSATKIVNLNEIGLGQNWFPVTVLVESEDKVVFDFDTNNLSTTIIENITIADVDNNKELLIINNNDNFVINKSNNVLINGTTVTNEFNGNASNYVAVNDFYNSDDNYLIPDGSLLSKYNGVIVTNLIVFSVAAITFLFYFFFRKPLQDYIIRRKQNKQLTNKN